MYLAAHKLAFWHQKSRQLCTPDGVCSPVRQEALPGDPKIVRYFNGAWCLASDAYAWSVPFWGAFCDLCSEEWVLHGDTPDEAPDVANLTGQTL